MIKTVRLGFAAAQNYGKKHFATAVKATKELKAKVTTPGWVKSKSISIGSKVEKHIKRHPIKYTAAGAGVTGFGFAKTHSGQEKKLKAYFGTLPKSDPRYKALKKHRKNLKAWGDAGFPRV